MCTDPNLAWQRSANESHDFEAVDKAYHDRALAAPADECLQVLDEYYSTRPDCTYYSRWYWAARQSAWLAKLVNGSMLARLADGYWEPMRASLLVAHTSEESRG
jgi:hypothetical protein